MVQMDNPTYDFVKCVLYCQVIVKSVIVADDTRRAVTRRAPGTRVAWW